MRALVCLSLAAAATALTARVPDDAAAARGAYAPVRINKPALADEALRLRGGEKHSLSLKGASPMVKTCAFFASLDALLLGYDIGVVSARRASSRTC